MVKKGTLALSSPVLTLTIDPQAIDLLALERRYRNSTRTANSIRIPLSSLSLSTAETVSTTIQIPIRTITQTKTLSIDGTISATGEGTQTTVGASFKTPALTIGTSLTLEGQVRYYTSEGDQVGRGPLPPTVGKETSYWVIASIKNGGNTLRSPTFTATLLPHTSMGPLVSATEGETPIYSPTTRTVTWKGRSLPPNAVVDIAFEVMLTPTPGMIGTSPPLIEILRATGIDEATGKSLESTVRTNLGISLPLDERGRVKGILITP